MISENYILVLPSCSSTDTSALPKTIHRWCQKTGGEMESRTDDVTPTDNNVAEGETR